VDELVVIFRTHSNVEASVVAALLEAHHVPAITTSAVPKSVFPLNVTDLAEVRISVNAAHAEEARSIIDSHRSEVPSGQLVRLWDGRDGLQRAIGYRFLDEALLERAMTHTSRANEEASGEMVDNESLEFLGDAILGFCIAELLFLEFEDLTEGEKSKIKASLVSTPSLARQAERLGLGDHLLLGRGEDKTGGRRKPALLADSYEALLAAIYLDGGIDETRRFVRREFEPLFDQVRREGLVDQDHKSALQEFLQSRDEPLPVYRLTDASGPDHRKTFQVEVSVRGEALAEGSGPSKKEAEQDAARLALEKLVTK
jgi:ribonuclease-3